VISLLTTLVSTVAAFGQLCMWALVSSLNLLLAAIGTTVSAALGLLPTMSNAPALGTPTWLSWLTWFYPVGGLIAGLTTAVGIWISYLAIRYILRLVRAL
jgi:hypothetical protein